MALRSLSRVTHKAMTGRDISWCGYAWSMREQSRFWRAWVMVFGAGHCCRSFEYYQSKGRNIDA